MVEIIFENEPAADTRAAILEDLTAFNQAQTGGTYPPPRPFAFSVRDRQSKAARGGLIGRISYGWMYIELLSVAPDLRGQRLGETLMARAEAFAREHKCRGIWVDSYTFQAPGFYEKLGFSQFGEIADYPPGFSRHFLLKPLS